MGICVYCRKALPARKKICEGCREETHPRCVDCNIKLGIYTKAKRCHSCAMRHRYEDPAERLKTSEATRRQWASGVMDGVPAKISETISNIDKEIWKARNDKVSKALKQYYIDNPKARKLASEKSKAAHKRGCYDEMYKDPEWRRKDSEARKRGWERGLYNNIGNSSKLEISTIDALEEVGIICERQYSPEGCTFVFDAYLSEYDTLVEVDGDYWHSERRPGSLERDDEKDEWAVCNGYNIIRIPECVVIDSGTEFAAYTVCELLGS